MHERKTKWELHKNAASCFEQASQKLQLHGHLPPILQTIKDKQDMVSNTFLDCVMVLNKLWIPGIFEF